ncbi:MAG: hypothetical protein ACP5KW_12280, partial [Thermoproteota archaeon]
EIEYNILKDGDRHLRGKIAEEIFMKVKDKIIPSEKLLFCSTYDLRFTLVRIPYSEASKIVSQYALGNDPLLLSYNEAEEKLNKFRKALGINIHKNNSLEELHNMTYLKNTRILYLDRCILCLDKGEIFVGGFMSYLRSSCLNKCLELGYISKKQFVYQEFSDYVYQVSNEEFRGVLEDFLKADFQLNYGNAFRVLLKLDETSVKFLYEVYGGKWFDLSHGQLPFDYIAVNDRGEKYLIDVTSVRGEYNPAGLSKREKEIAEQAKRIGFRILVPTVKFLEDWKVVVKLSEI